MRCLRIATDKVDEFRFVACYRGLYQPDDQRRNILALRGELSWMTGNDRAEKFEPNSASTATYLAPDGTTGSSNTLELSNSKAYARI